MKAIDIVIKTYDALHNRKGISPFVFSPLRKCVRFVARTCLPRLLQKESCENHLYESDVIISFTSFPARINDVHLVVRCLKRQTISPAKIILWLSKEQFEGIQIPNNLLSLVDNIFQIRYVDGDIRSHKKYFYVLSEFPDSRVVLVDDDIYYPSDMLEGLIKESDLYPDEIICRYGSIMKYKDGLPLPYNDWWWEISNPSENQNFFFGTGGGVLLRKDLLYQDVLSKHLSQKLTPLADDIWINAMVNLAGTRKRKIKCGLLLPIRRQQIKLSTENCLNRKNDEQLLSIINHYSSYKLNPFKQQ